MVVSDVATLAWLGGNGAGPESLEELPPIPTLGIMQVSHFTDEHKLW